jgi:multimeric flavodoxin WrbA
MLAEAEGCEALAVADESSGLKRLLVVYQSRSGSTARMVEAALVGARLALDLPIGENAGAGEGVPTNATYPGASGCGIEVRHAFEASVDDVLGASAILIATPANFGYMSGAVKDFFERIYDACLEANHRMPYSMIVKGDTDVEGAASSIRKIATGMRWREVLQAILVTGRIEDFHIDEAHEMGATLTAGMEAGIY